MAVRSVQSVGKAVIHVLQLGRRVEVLHGAEVFGGDGLEGGRPEMDLRPTKIYKCLFQNRQEVERGVE